MNIGVDDFENDFGNLAQCPCDSILDSHTAVGPEHRDKCTQSLVDEWTEDSGVRTFENGSECHDGGFSLLPVDSSDVAFDELDDSGHDWVADVLGEQLKT